MTKTEALDLFGSLSEMAKALGVKYQIAWGWREDLPREVQCQIEQLTHGLLKASAKPWRVLVAEHVAAMEHEEEEPHKETA